MNNGNKFCSSKSFTSILILLSPDWNELVSIPSEIGNLASLQELDLGELVSIILELTAELNFLELTVELNFLDFLKFSLLYGQ